MMWFWSIIVVGIVVVGAIMIAVKSKEDVMVPDEESADLTVADVTRLRDIFQTLYASLGVTELNLMKSLKESVADEPVYRSLSAIDSLVNDEGSKYRRITGSMVQQAIMLSEPSIVSDIVKFGREIASLNGIDLKDISKDKPSTIDIENPELLLSVIIIILTLNDLD